METTSKPAERTATRSIEARLSDDELRRLDERARRAGVDRAECIGQLIRDGLAADSDAEALHPGMTFEEILAPVHREFAESRMTEGELTRFFEEVREEAWQDRQRTEGEK
jgi:metal-responsive CopG/Arc/MetJ family transcriptional regulator